MDNTTIIESVFGATTFEEYEQNTCNKYQEIAEREIFEKLQSLLSNEDFLNQLKRWGGQLAVRFIGYREIAIRLKSGRHWKINSPVFIRSKSKNKRGRSPKRRKGVLVHLGLECIGITNKISPALLKVCLTMAVLCPSFEVAANALKNIGVVMNDRLLQRITHNFAALAMKCRVDCQQTLYWKKPGLRILICVDGGRIRERLLKRGKRKAGQKRPGYRSEWFEPRLFTISIFDETGKKIKSIEPLIDGSCGSLDDFFDLLKRYLSSINLDEATQIVFCSDNGKGLWTRTEKLIRELDISHAKQILDYTHAKQNMGKLKSIITAALKLTDNNLKKLSKTIRELLWKGDIKQITSLCKDFLAKKRKPLKAALKKLSEYFGSHFRFQYKKFSDNNLPTGSGTVESAIRRIINLRIKGTGLFWKRQHAEHLIFLRSLVLSGKLDIACRKVFANTLNFSYSDKVNTHH